MIPYPNRRVQGLSFFFPIPSEYSDLYASGKADPPLEFPDSTSPIANRLVVFSGSHLVAASPPQQDADDPYFEEVKVTVGEGLYFAKRQKHVLFGDTCQDVLSTLGPPTKVYYKEEDKMRIHSAGNSDKGIKCSDYFYNYFELGFDLLFDAYVHQVKKIVLHTNFPGLYDFGRYYKCNFSISCSSSESGSTQQQAATMDTMFHQDLIDVHSLDTANQPCTQGACELNVTPDTKWNDVRHAFGAPLGKPAVYNRGSTADPFGPTKFYGYKGIVYEVMLNGHIASVTLYRVDA
eukprot:Colp12_sorted_trinity150504_noHs@142